MLRFYPASLCLTVSTDNLISLGTAPFRGSFPFLHNAGGSERKTERLLSSPPYGQGDRSLSMSTKGESEFQRRGTVQTSVTEIAR